MAGTTHATHGFSQADSGDGWVYHRGGVYRFPAHLTAGPDGFTAAAATVPGMTGRGPTEPAALDALTAVLADTLAQSLAIGRPLAKTDPTPAPAGSKPRVVIVRLEATA